MKKISIFVFLSLVILSCTVSFNNDDKPSQEEIATQVAISLTATALDESLNQVDEAVIITTVEPTEAKVDFSNPKKDLGSPTWSHDLSSWTSWNESPGVKEVATTTTFDIANGKLVAKSDATGKGNHWWLNYNQFKNAYLEAKFETGNCNGDDQYGLAFRAADYYDGIAYYFHVTCDGHYDLRKWTQSGSTMLLGMPASSEINAGANQSNLLGVRIEDDSIRLYVNDTLVHELNDSEISTQGHFGLFINARKTAGFTVYLDEIKYWLLD